MSRKNKDYTAEYVARAVDITVDMEVSRCESLRKMCEVMLTGSSILSVALLAVANPLFVFFAADAGWLFALLALYAIVLTLLAASMILAVLSMARFRYTALASPIVLFDDIYKPGEILTGLNMAKSYAQSLEGPYQGLKERNDKMRGLLTASQVTLVVALGVSLIGGGVMLIGGCALLSGTI